MHPANNLRRPEERSIAAAAAQPIWRAMQELHNRHYRQRVLEK
jgi:hypothetical protein